MDVEDPEPLDGAEPPPPVPRNALSGQARNLAPTAAATHTHARTHARTHAHTHTAPAPLPAFPPPNNKNAYRVRGGKRRRRCGRGSAWGGP